MITMQKKNLIYTQMWFSLVDFFKQTNNGLNN